VSSKARIAGFFYLLVFLMGFAGLAGMRLVVSGDAAATAANILAHETLYRFGWAMNILTTVSYVVVTALFYELFKPVSRSVSLTAAFLSLTGCATGAIAGALQLAPFIFLKDPSLSVFRPDQSQALTLAFLKLATQVYNTGIVFFACYCLLIGVLILRSSFLPRILGYGMLFASAGWFTFLWPPLVHAWFPFVLLPGIIGEGMLTFRLLAFGIDNARWSEQAAVTAIAH
jgi:uncharacterized protein DUF4386